MANFKNFTDSLKSAVTNVSDIAKDLANNAGDKAKDFASSAGDMAKSLSRRAKIAMELSTERDNIEKAFAEIGRLYYEMNKEEPGEFFIQLFDQVKFANEHVEALEEELANLKDGDDEDVSFENVVSFDEANNDVEVEVTEGEAAGEPTAEIEITIEKAPEETEE